MWHPDLADDFRASGFRARQASILLGLSLTSLFGCTPYLVTQDEAAAVAVFPFANAGGAISMPLVQFLDRFQPAPAPIPKTPKNPFLDRPIAKPLSELLAVEHSPGPWTSPVWYPEGARLSVLDLMDDSTPVWANYRSGAEGLYVFDVDAGRVLVSNGAEERRPVASLTKLVTAMAMTTEDPDMDREVCIGFEEQPSWPGTTTRLGRGTCAAGWDMIGAALVRSDNGAARSLVQVSGLPLYPFVQRMNQVAADLGMHQSSFSGPTGVEDDNLSTARDMTRAVYAASQHPTLAPVLNSTFWEVSDARRGLIRRMFSTNRLKWHPWLEFDAAKTGYTDTARSCFTAVVRVNGKRTIALTMLGAKNGTARWEELQALLRRVARSQM